MRRRSLRLLALLGLGFGSISLTSCGNVATAPQSSAGGNAGGDSSGGGVGAGAPAISDGPVLIVSELDEEMGPKWFCHPNTTRRSREDATPSCPWISSCDGVECAYGITHEVRYSPPALTCRQGYEVGLPAGACCYECTRNQEPLEAVTCVDACPATPPSCLRGSRAVAVSDACCPECVVDQDYCNSDVDCVLATRPANCCACVEAVSARRLEADDCYASVSAALATPDNCQADQDCTRVDCDCPAEVPTSAVCVEHRCTAL